MGQTIALVATGVVVCFCAIAAAAAICWHLYFLRKELASARECIERGIQSLESLNKSHSESAEAMASTPGLLKGMIAIAETQVTSITGLEAAIDKLRAGMLAGDGSGVSNNEDGGEFDEMESERERLRRAGLSDPEVAARLQERKLYGGFDRR